MLYSTVCSSLDCPRAVRPSTERLLKQELGSNAPKVAGTRKAIPRVCSTLPSFTTIEGTELSNKFAKIYLQPAGLSCKPWLGVHSEASHRF
jgi:hypothetical protein